MITVKLDSQTPTINGAISTNSPLVTGNLETAQIDTSNLRIRVTNLENNAIGNINLSYNEATSILTLTTQNIKNEDIGTARNITIPAGVQRIIYNEANNNIALELTNGTIMNVSLKESFDKIDRYLNNLQDQINELELSKLDKVAYMSSQDIDDYFNN